MPCHDPTFLALGIGPAPQAFLTPRSATRSGVSRSCSGWITRSRKRCRLVSRDAGSCLTPSIVVTAVSFGIRYGVTPRICGLDGSEPVSGNQHQQHRVFRYQLEFEVSFLGSPLLFRRPGTTGPAECINPPYAPLFVLIAPEKKEKVMKYLPPFWCFYRDVGHVVGCAKLGAGGLGVLRQRRGRSQLRQWHGYHRNQQRPPQRVR